MGDEKDGDQAMTAIGRLTTAPSIDDGGTAMRTPIGELRGHSSLDFRRAPLSTPVRKDLHAQVHTHPLAPAMFAPDGQVRDDVSHHTTRVDLCGPGPRLPEGQTHSNGRGLAGQVLSAAD